MESKLSGSLDDLREAAVTTIIDGLNGVINGTNEDLRTFATAIYNDSMEAAATGAFHLFATLKNTTLLLAERNRIRWVDGMQAIGFKVLQAALGVALRFAIPTIPNIPSFA